MIGPKQTLRVTGSERVGTHAQLPAALDELVAKARAERKGK